MNVAYTAQHPWLVGEGQQYQILTARHGTRRFFAVRNDTSADSGGNP